MRGLRKAIDVAGGYVPLAQALGVHPRTVRKWLLAGGMPPRQARRIQKLTGIRIGGNALDHGEVPELREAVEFGFTIPGLAKRLKIQKQTIANWKARKAIPDKRKKQIDRLING